MSKRDIYISVCVPAFNEEENIEEAVVALHSSLSQTVERFEIIIVDDASTDSTFATAQELARKYDQVKVLRHMSNRGMGSCYRDALSVAEGDYFTWFPADHENSAEEIINCIHQLKEDYIVTSYHCGQDMRPKLRRLISRLYTWILNKRFKLNLKYYNGLTIIPTKVLKAIPLKSEGFFFSAEAIIRSVRSGCQVIGLTAPLRGRISGKSKAFSLSSIFRMIKDLIRIYAGNKKQI